MELVEQKNRSPKFELMRIYSMFMIILLHILVYGNVVKNCENEILKTFFLYLENLLVMSVNSFILLTGYYKSNSLVKISKIINLILKVIFYSILILFVLILLRINHISIDLIFKSISLFSLSKYSYISYYLVLYILSDYINKFLNCLKKQELEHFIILSFFVLSILPFLTGIEIFSSGKYNLFHFVLLYIIGAYLRLYPIRNSYHFKHLTNNLYRYILIFIIFLTSFLKFLIEEFAFKINIINIDSYSLFISSPLIIIQSVCYFELFNNLNIRNNKINMFAKLILGVYLIINNPLVYNNIYKFLKIDNGPFSSIGMIFNILIVTFIIYAFCSFIEFLCQKLFYRISRFSWFKKLVIKVRRFINSFGIIFRW